MVSARFLHGNSNTGATEDIDINLKMRILEVIRTGVSHECSSPSILK